MDAACLGDVVGGLLLREVGDMAGHGGGDHKATGAAFLEVVTDGFCAMEATSKIGLDDLVPIFHGAIEDTAIGSTASIGDEGIDLVGSALAMGALILEDPKGTLPKSLMTSATNFSALA